jgi:hypothetical protein
MLSLHSFSKEPEKSSLTSGFKWNRRSDLTALIRLKIASEVLCFRRWGTVSRLAAQNQVSRPFIYALTKQLKAQVCNIFEQKKVAEPASNWSILAQILQFRLVGRCSLSSISDLLSSNPVFGRSVGWISEQLQAIGTKLGNQIQWSGETVAATDELYYAGHRPI